MGKIPRKVCVTEELSLDNGKDRTNGNMSKEGRDLEGGTGARRPARSPELGKGGEKE